MACSISEGGYGARGVDRSLKPRQSKSEERRRPFPMVQKEDTGFLDIRRKEAEKDASFDVPQRLYLTHPIDVWRQGPGSFGSSYIKMYPSREWVELKDHSPRSDAQAWLTSLFKDPIVTAMQKSSHLTKTQLETFLIDILAEKIAGKPMVFEKKAKLRLVKCGVSRGAFNRTLAQARRNTIKSIYTLILLGYLGVFDSPRLEPYIEIANKIRSYTDAYRGAWKSGRTSNEHLRILNMLQKEIERGLQELSAAKTLSSRT